MNKLIKKAFTLIELLVVIAIIGILSGLIVVSMGGMTNKATIAKSQVFSNSLRNSLMLNIVGEWKMDEGSGSTANDTWGGLNNGTLAGFADITAGYGDTHASGWMNSSNCISGTCLQFDGVDDYINCGNGSSLGVTTGSFTVILWAKSTFKAIAGIIGKKNDAFTVANPGWAIQYAGSPAKLYTAISNGTTNIQYGTGLDTFDWTQIGITRMDDNKVYLIKNGLLALEGTLAGDISNSVNLEIGRGYRSSYYYSANTIDDVRIYNAAVPISLVKEHYYAGLNKMWANGNITNEEYKQKIEEISLNK